MKSFSLKRTQLSTLLNPVEAQCGAYVDKEDKQGKKGMEEEWGMKGWEDGEQVQAGCEKIEKKQVDGYVFVEW